MNENMMNDAELREEMTRTAYNRYIRYGVASNVLMEGSDMLPGYLLNEEFSKKLVDAVNAGNVIRSLCSGVTTKDDRIMPIVSGHGQPSWVPEGSAIPMVTDTFDRIQGGLSNEEMDIAFRSLSDQAGHAKGQGGADYGYVVSEGLPG